MFFLFFFISYCLTEENLPPLIESQLDSANLVIHGLYRGSSFKKSKDDSIISQFSFKVINYLGAEEINRNSFPVILKSGVWNGRIYNSSERNFFHPGDEVVLFLRLGKNGYEFLDKGAGIYKVYLNNGEIFLSAMEAAENPRLAKIKAREFNKLSRVKFGKELIFTEDLNKKISQQKALKRDIASFSGRKISEDPLMLILILGILGAIGLKLGRSL